MKTPKLLLLVASLCGAAWLSTTGASEPLLLTLKSDHGLLPYDKASEVLIRVNVTGKKAPLAKRPPIHLALVLDRSGSMSGKKIEQARQAAQYIVGQLGPKDQIALVIYDSNVQVLVPMTAVTNPSAIQKIIRGIEPGGSTALYGGVMAGAGELRRVLDEQAVNRVILLSDGLANVGPQSPDDLARLGRDLQKKGIAVSTVGLGDDYNENLMVALAEASHANYYYVKDVEKLPSIFQEELQVLQQLVARQIKIIIDLPPGLESVEVVGYPEFRPRGRTLEITLPEIAQQQERYFLVRGNLSGQKAGEVRIARAQASYVDLDARERNCAPQDLTVATERSETKVLANVRTDVRAEYNRQQALETRDAAIKLADKGLVKEAVSRLRSMASMNLSQSKELNAPKLAEEAASLEAQAAQLESDGAFTNSSRKSIQYDNYQKMNQKR